MIDYLIYLTIGWLVCTALSFYIGTLNRLEIRVGDLLYMIIFGPFYFLMTIADLDKVIWRKADRKVRDGDG